MEQIRMRASVERLFRDVRTLIPRYITADNIHSRTTDVWGLAHSLRWQETRTTDRTVFPPTGMQSTSRTILMLSPRTRALEVHALASPGFGIEDEQAEGGPINERRYSCSIYYRNCNTYSVSM
jgi:hypothetical protein